MIGFRTVVSPSVSNKSSKSNDTTTPASVAGDAGAAGALVPRNLVGSSALRTLDDVRDQISQEIAINAITKAEYIDGKTRHLINFLELTSKKKKRRKNRCTFRHIQR